MSRPIASFEFNKQTISTLKRQYNNLGKQLVKELAIEFQDQMQQAIARMINDFYMSYHPRHYKRTYALLKHSWKITRHVRGAKGRVTMTWLYDEMQPYYDRALGDDAPLASDVVASFEEGYHGPNWENIPYRYEGVTPAEFIDKRVDEIVADFCNNKAQRMIDRAVAKMQ